jgi:peptidoglycan/xylan/chitin deacetylase (PgdA/CDA1 family)
VEKLAALSVDLDEIDNYLAIFGLPDSALEGAARQAVYTRGLGRFESFFREHDMPATFFAIGRDLARAENRTRLKALANAGHEIANHTQNHLYDLTRRERSVQLQEVRGGADAIEAAVGVRPVGFRAPGYTITDTLVDVLRSEGVQYDSSVFPCPPYYLAKSAALALIRLRGSRSMSILDHPRVLSASANPYRMGASYAQRGNGLIELPAGVTGNLSARFPYTGTFVVMWGVPGARLLTRLISGRPFVNLVLHGADLCGATEDGLGALAPFQRDLQRSVAEKRAALSEAVSVLKRQGFRFVRLSEAAQRLA